MGEDVGPAARAGVAGAGAVGEEENVGLLGHAGRIVPGEGGVFMIRR